MKNFSEVLKAVFKVEAEAEASGHFSIETKVLKIVEEVGEVATEVLKLNGYKNSDEAVEAVKSNLEEEIVDVIMTGMVLAKHVGLNEERMAEIFDMKLKKWRKKHIKRTKKIPV